MEIRTQHHSKLVPDEAARFIQYWYHSTEILMLQHHTRRRYSERKGRSSSARAGRNARARWVNFLKSRPSPLVAQSLFDLLALVMRRLLVTANLQLMTSSDIMQAKLMEQQVAQWPVIVKRHASHVTHHTTSHVTRHTSHSTHVTHHTSHVTRHTSHVTRHTSHVTRHTSHVTRHMSHVKRQTSQVARCTSHVARHIRHTSRITRNTSHVTRHT